VLSLTFAIILGFITEMKKSNLLMSLVGNKKLFFCLYDFTIMHGSNNVLLHLFSWRKLSFFPTKQGRYLRIWLAVQCWKIISKKLKLCAERQWIIIVSAVRIQKMKAYLLPPILWGRWLSGLHRLESQALKLVVTKLMMYEGRDKH
jgi:hypothetical protein